MVEVAGNAADSAVPDPLRCLRCGYSLRGLVESGACPECGLPIAASRAGTPLLHASRAWLRRLAQGASVNAVALAALIAYSVMIRFDWLPRDGPAGSRQFPLRALISCLVDLALFSAAWMLTGPLPQARERPFSARSAARAAALVSFAFNVVYMFAHPPTFLGRSLLYVAVLTVGLVTAVVWTVYLRTLAFGIGQAGLALQIGVSVVGWVVCDVVDRLLPWAYLVLVLWLAPRTRPHAPRHPTAIYFVRWAFLVYEMLVLVQFRRVFLKASANGTAPAPKAEEDPGVL